MAFPVLTKFAGSLIAGGSLFGLAQLEIVQNKLIEGAAQIPVPAFINNISTTGLPNNMIYFINLFQIDYALAVVISASFIKIIYRKILGLT